MNRNLSSIGKVKLKEFNKSLINHHLTNNFLAHNNDIFINNFNSLSYNFKHILLSRLISMSAQLDKSQLNTLNQNFYRLSSNLDNESLTYKLFELNLINNKVKLEQFNELTMINFNRLLGLLVTKKEPSLVKLIYLISIKKNFKIRMRTMSKLIKSFSRLNDIRFVLIILKNFKRSRKNLDSQQYYYDNLNRLIIKSLTHIDNTKLNAKDYTDYLSQLKSLLHPNEFTINHYNVILDKMIDKSITESLFDFLRLNNKVNEDTYKIIIRKLINNNYNKFEINYVIIKRLLNDLMKLKLELSCEIIQLVKPLFKKVKDDEFLQVITSYHYHHYHHFHRHHSQLNDNHLK